MIRSKKITNAARDQDCTLNILGVCNFDPATVVFCHFPDESHGMAQKADDVSGGFCCSACHDAIDGRVKSQEFKELKDWYLRRSQTRTMRKLFELRVVKV